MVNPLLAPHVHIAWRNDTLLVIEDPAAPESQVHVGNANPGVLQWLRMCNGGHTLEDLLGRAQSAGMQVDAALQLLRTLDEAGLLALAAAPAHEPTTADEEHQPGIAQDLEALALCGRDAHAAYERRRAHHVWIEGGTRVAHALVDALASAHIGSMQVRAGHASRRLVSLRDVGAFGPTRADLGVEPTTALRRHIKRRGIENPARERRPIVVACDAHLDPADEVPYQEAGVPYLRVLTTSRFATIGPLTLPGHSVCWSCIALHRTDADPQWPYLLAQFDQARRSFAPVDDLFAMWVASDVTSRLLQVIDTDDPSSLVNTTFHIDRRRGEVRRRTWRVHPDCPCQWHWDEAA